MNNIGFTPLLLIGFNKPNFRQYCLAPGRLLQGPRYICIYCLAPEDENILDELSKFNSLRSGKEELITT